MNDQARSKWTQAAFLFLLSAMVVLWGTEYKLSLYKTDVVAQSPAKLCTLASDTAKLHVHMATQPVEADALLLESAAADIEPGVDLTAALGYAVRIEAPLPYSPRPFPQTAFRPPPALTRASV